MPVSTYGANAICTAVVASNTYLALLTSIPGTNDTGSTIAEPAGVDYDRFTLDHSYWSVPAGGYSTYNFDITALPTSNWGLIIAYALCSAATAGQVLAYEYFVAGMNVATGSRFNIGSGQLRYGVQ